MSTAFHMCAVPDVLDVIVVIATVDAIAVDAHLSQAKHYES